MKIGITGGVGFIGGHVADYCIAQGHTPAVAPQAGFEPATDGLTIRCSAY